MPEDNKIVEQLEINYDKEHEAEILGKLEVIKKIVESFDVVHDSEDPVFKLRLKKSGLTIIFNDETGEEEGFYFNPGVYKSNTDVPAETPDEVERGEVEQ